MVVDFPSPGLYDIDVFSSNRLAYLDSGFADREFRKQGGTLGDAEDLTDCFCQGWVGRAPEDHNISDHRAERRRLDGGYETFERLAVEALAERRNKNESVYLKVKAMRR